MCGRYYVDDDTAKEIKKLVRRIDADLSRVHSGDVYPSHSAMVLTGKSSHLSANTMQWGFPKYQQKGLIINARAETVREKKTFQDSIFHRRCIIPAKHYYEWDSAKTKVTFSKSDRPVLYMAGFYQLFPDGEHFVILTTEANESVRAVHDRMPLILEQQELEDWIYDDRSLDTLLRKVPVCLDKYQDYEQQTLKFD